MAVRLKPLSEQVMVITGASSGIGLATAREAAHKGACVVLASRNDEALAEIVRDITRQGGKAIHVAADVGKRDELERVAQAAIEHYGRIDTWVNNAGHAIYGRVEEVSDEDHERLMQTNFWGVVYGSQIAAKHLRAHGGAIINIGSIASDMTLPLLGMYCASKHAVKSFTDALRMELEEQNAPISVTLIKPASIDTPFTQHAKKYTEHEAKLPGPVYAPDEVAHAILHVACHPERDVYVGGSGKAFTTFQKHAPNTMDWLGKNYLLGQLTRDEPVRDREGALHQAGHGGQVRGDHPGMVRETSYYTRASLRPILTTAVITTIAGAAAATFFRNAIANSVTRQWRGF